MKKTFTISNEFARNAAIQSLQALDVTAPHNVSIAPMGKDRTAAQNGLYFHWVGCIANHIGEDKDAMHGQLKAMFLAPIFVRDDADYAVLWTICKGDDSKPLKALVAQTSITQASKDQMREYLDEIKRMCVNQGIPLTVPDHWGWLGL